MKDDAENTYLFARSIQNGDLLRGNGYLSDISFAFNEKGAVGVTKTQIRGYTNQELTDAAAAGGDLGKAAAGSVVYHQYTNKDSYPYPMPDGMTSYGDWSHSNGYTIAFDANAPEGAIVNGTMQNMTGVSYAQDTALTRNQYVCKDGSKDNEEYHFAYWTLTRDGSGKSYSDGAFVRALAKEGQTVTLYAQWIKGYWSYSYTGSYQVFTAPVDGVYKFETWGAQGGSGMSGKATDADIQARDSINTTKVVGQGGKGAYASNYVSLKKGQTVYVYVGGKGDTGQRKDRPFLDVEGNPFKFKGKFEGLSSFDPLPGKEIVPRSFGEIYLLGSNALATGYDRRHHDVVPHHILAGDVLHSILLVRIIHDQGPERRDTFPVILHESGVQVRDETHPQFNGVAAEGHKPGIVRIDDLLEIEFMVHLHPGRQGKVPGIDHGNRRTDHALHTSDKVFLA